jgi:hypothetical protein
MWKTEQSSDLRWKNEAMKEVELQWDDHSPKYEDIPNIARVEDY